MESSSFTENGMVFLLSLLLGVYALGVLFFFVFSGFALYHVARYGYFTPTVHGVTVLYLVGALIILGLSVWMLLPLPWDAVWEISTTVGVGVP